MLSQFSDYDVVSFDFSGFGRSKGEPSEQQICQDTLQVFEELCEYYPSVVLWGYSLGGAAAAYAATTTCRSWRVAERTGRARLVHKSLSALVLQSTFASTSAALEFALPGGFASVGKSIADIYTSLTTQAWLTELTVPLFVAHSFEDELFPTAHAEVNFSAAKAAPIKQLFWMYGTHAEYKMQGRRGLLFAVLKFLEECRVKRISSRRYKPLMIGWIGESEL